MMRQDRFTLTPGPSVILSGDNARAGNQRLPRRRQSASGGNLRRGEPPVSQTEVGGGTVAAKNLGLRSRVPRSVLRRTQTRPSGGWRAPDAHALHPVVLPPHSAQHDSLGAAR